MLAQPLVLTMVRSFDEIGRTMGMRTLAENGENGENGEIRNTLGRLGVDCVQGFAVGRPEPLDTLRFPPSASPRNRTSGIARDVGDREAS